MDIKHLAFCNKIFLMDERYCESGSSSSSIALLQERFKQLQRAREVRKERELLKELAESKRVYHSVRHEPIKSSFSNEYIHSSSSSGRYAAHNHGTDNLQVSRTRKYANLPYIDACMNRTQVYDNDDGSDVDTSLHL